MPKKEIPKTLKTCRTVGALIKELERLPATLPIEAGFSKGVKPVVFNQNCEWAKPHLELTENDGTWD